MGAPFARTEDGRLDQRFFGAPTRTAGPATRETNWKDGKTESGDRRGRVAGLTLARSLKRAPVDVTLLDRNNYHLFTPLRYQVASAYLDPSQIADSIRALIRPMPNCDFRLAEVSGIDLSRRVVGTDHGEVGYDQLVLCTGSGTNYFGIKVSGAKIPSAITQPIARTRE